MKAEDYEAVFASLPTSGSDRELEAAEVGSSTGLWVARDRTGRRHLLIQTGTPSDLSAEATRGLGISTVQHRIAGRPDTLYVDLTCLDPAVAPTFAALAADIVTDILNVAPADRTDLVRSVIREWRWFWAVDPQTMTRADAIGLFGELWFLNRWARPTPQTVQAWEGSNGSRHDFQWPQHSVEVKTTARSGPIVHSIEHLDQLDDPVTGTLYLHSLRIVPDALAANSVHTLAQTALAALADQPAVRNDLTAKLAARGYNPAARDESSATYRVAEDVLYEVSVGFPRLTSASFDGGLPKGILQLAYRIDMGTCDQWRLDLRPEDWPP